jgi:hypothetical protein
VRVTKKFLTVPSLQSFVFRNAVYLHPAIPLATKDLYKGGMLTLFLDGRGEAITDTFISSYPRTRKYLQKQL